MLLGQEVAVSCLRLKVVSSLRVVPHLFGFWLVEGTYILGGAHCLPLGLRRATTQLDWLRVLILLLIVYKGLYGLVVVVGH